MEKKQESMSQKEYSIFSIPLEGDKLILDIFSLSKVTDTSYIAGHGKFFERSHSHTYYELHIITEGGNHYLIGDREVVVSKGEFLLIPPNMTHTLIRREANSGKYGLCFLVHTTDNASEEERKTVSLLPRDTYIVSDTTEAMQQYGELATQEKKSQAWGSARNVRLLSGLILVEVVRMLDNHLEPISETTPYHHDERFALAKQFIKDNLRNGVTSQFVANAIHVSVRQLNRIFQRESGLTVAGYMETYRYHIAKKMLATTSDTLQKLSLELGFTSQYNFSRFFKRMEGQTPSKYRQAKKNPT